MLQANPVWKMFEFRICALGQSDRSVSETLLQAAPTGVCCESVYFMSVVEVPTDRPAEFYDNSVVYWGSRGT